MTLCYETCCEGDLPVSDAADDGGLHCVAHFTSYLSRHNAAETSDRSGRESNFQGDYYLIYLRNRSSQERR